jgi:GNAT superfamily N-acetyltransferase
MTADATNRARLLATYDAQLRGEAETPSAIAVSRLGPLRLVTFVGKRGFVSYKDLDGLYSDALNELVTGAVSHFSSKKGRENGAIEIVEWKTRGHDHAPGLHDALTANGFVPDEAESIMIGDASGLAVDVPLPAGVTLRRATSEKDVRAMSAMQDVVFGDPVSEEAADALLSRLSRADGMELWIAEADGEIVTAGRLELVPNSDFAGIWGGATLPQWRGKGIYRALTSARARSALAHGKTLIHSDSTEYSRPILERSGLVAVSTTTPYLWRPAVD